MVTRHIIVTVSVCTDMGSSYCILETNKNVMCQLCLHEKFNTQFTTSTLKKKRE